MSVFFGFGRSDISVVRFVLANMRVYASRLHLQEAQGIYTHDQLPLSPRAPRQLAPALYRLVQLLDKCLTLLFMCLLVLVDVLANDFRASQQRAARLTRSNTGQLR